MGRYVCKSLDSYERHIKAAIADRNGYALRSYSLRIRQTAWNGPLHNERAAALAQRADKAADDLGMVPGPAPRWPGNERIRTIV